MRAHHRFVGILVITGALAVAAFVATRDLIDVLLMTVVVAVLAGSYLLRRYARAALVYRNRSQEQEEHHDFATRT